MVFQDPYPSLNPRMTVGEIIAEGPEIHRGGLREGLARKERVLLDAASASTPTYANRYPHEFSGGQRQRIAIARALAVEPEDDRLRRAGQRARRLGAGADRQPAPPPAGRARAHLPLRRARSLCGEAHRRPRRRDVSRPPGGDRPPRPTSSASVHPYTQALVSALPTADIKGNKTGNRIVLSGDLPSPADPPSGCRFRTRCWMAQQKCTDEEPELIERGTGRPTKCHFVTPTVDAPAAV